MISSMIFYSLDFLVDLGSFLVSAPVLPFVALFLVSFAFSIVKVVTGR